MPLSRTIESFMTKSPVVVERSTSVPRALEIMAEGGFHHLPVMASGRVVGVVTEHELKAVDNIPSFQPALCTVGDFVQSPPYTVSPSATLLDVARVMAEVRHDVAVVVEDGRVLGIFTVTNALRALIAVCEA